jgi:RNA polymerase sigma factor (sigma-70 family)
MTEEYFNKAYSENSAKLLRYVYGIVKDTHTAEEVVQEVFLRLAKQDVAKVDCNLAAWLFVVSRNVSLKVLAKSKRVILITDHFRINEISASSDKSGPDNTFGLLNIAAVEAREYILGESPTDILCAAEQASADLVKISEAMSNLTDKHQQIIRLRYFEEKTYEEIAAIMKITEGNAGFMLNAAKKKLKAFYNELK